MHDKMLSECFKLTSVSTSAEDVTSLTVQKPSYFSLDFFTVLLLAKDVAVFYCFAFLPFFDAVISNNNAVKLCNYSEVQALWFPGHQIRRVSDGTRFFSMASSAMEAAKETKFGTTVA